MRAGREYALKRALAKLADQFDVVIIDCPPSLGVLTLNGLTAADEVIVPLQCETLAHRGVGQFLRTVADVQQITNPGLRLLGALPTLYDAAHHPHPRRAARRRRPLRPAGAGPADPAHGPFRRGQRFGLVGDGRAQEQRRGGLRASWRSRCSSTGRPAKRCRRSPSRSSRSRQPSPGRPRCRRAARTLANPKRLGSPLCRVAACRRPLHRDVAVFAPLVGS